MSYDIKDGGPAFPFNIPTTKPDGEPYAIYQGMSLRDYFAATCPSDICQIPYERNYREEAGEYLNSPYPVDGTIADKAKWNAAVEAKMRYAYADAMLAERSK